MESGKLKAQIRAAAARKKEEEKAKKGASTSLPKAANKGAPKRKGDGTDDRPTKKLTADPGDHTKPSSPKHGAGKGLMSAHGPVVPEDGRSVLTHKGYALERLDSILGEKEADACAHHSMQELGDSGLFDLARVCIFLVIRSVCFLLGYRSDGLTGAWLCRLWRA